MRTKFLLSAAGVLLATAPILGHHAFGGEFDPNKPVLLKGPVTKVEWVNPHAWIHLEVTKPDGTKEEWMVEGGTPNTLLRRGVTRESLKVGTMLVDRRLSGARPFAAARQRPQRHLPGRQEVVPRIVGHRRADRRRGSDGSAKADNGRGRGGR